MNRVKFRVFNHDTSEKDKRKSEVCFKITSKSLKFTKMKYILFLNSQKKLFSQINFNCFGNYDDPFKLILR